MKFWIAQSGIVFLIIVSGTSLWASTVVLRSSDLSRLISEKNENVEAARFHIKAQEKRTGSLARSFFPQFSASLGQEEFKTGSDQTEQLPYWKIAASINLYRGGRDQIESEIRDSSLGLAKNYSVLQYQSEIKDATLAFWSYIAVSKVIALRTEALEINKANIQSSRRRTGAGITSSADAAQFEIFGVTLSRELQKLKLQQDIYLNKLSVALGLDEHENIEIQEDFPANLEIKAEMASLNPQHQLDLRVQNEVTKIEALRAQQTSRWWVPELDLYASYGLPSLSEEYTRALRKDREWAAGLRLTLDLDRGVNDYREASALSLDAKAATKKANHRRREIVAAHHEMVRDLNALKELVANSGDDVERAQRFLKLTQSEYSRGVKNGPDLLESFRTYFDFREKQIEYQRDFQQVQIELESLMARGEML